MTGGFRLLETLRAEGGEARHLALHLERMGSSAFALGFAFDPDAVAADARTAAAAGPATARRMRILLDRAGVHEVQLLSAPAASGALRGLLTTDPIDSTMPLLGHKTTERAHLAGRARPDADDTLLVNERGELTEFTYGTVVLELGGRLLTPPLCCGLLPGVERRRALESGRVAEAVLTPADLAQADAVWHLNSMRGWTPVIGLGPGAAEPRA